MKKGTGYLLLVYVLVMAVTVAGCSGTEGQGVEGNQDPLAEESTLPKDQEDRGTGDAQEAPAGNGGQKGNARVIPILYHARKLDKYGYRDNRGNMVIEPQYDMARDFYGGLAAVKKGDKWGYIDIEGQVVIDFQFDDACDFSEGLAAVKVVSEWGYIDRQGNMVITPCLDSSNPYSDGLVEVRIGGKLGVMDEHGYVEWIASEFYEEGKLSPADEAHLDSGFRQFQEELLAAIERKDLDFLKKHINKNISYSFGAEPGIEGFFEEWELDTSPEESPLWEELRQVLELGGTFQDSEKTVFTAPYVFSRFPESYDPFLYVAAVGEGVKVYSKPHLNSPVIAELSYDIVRLIEGDIQVTHGEGNKLHWSKIFLPSGMRGYVKSEDVRSPIDYRAIFRKQEDVWKLDVFVAGD